tara:strand:+ start:20 stop:244 length:225 start_codon:yes stop_codon:yes gene_type:complete
MQELNRILNKVLKIDIRELNENLSMQDCEIWDSLKHMELIISIEENLNIELSMDDVMNMTDIGTIKKIVNEKLK